MRAILVSVGYDDLLAITLPYNKHHFEQVWVVTSTEDLATHKVCAANEVCVFNTNAFYRDGATFNKWLALELALDEMGREGWLCLMDADVLWPKDVHCQEEDGTLKLSNLNGWMLWQRKGQLFSPLRRMHANFDVPFQVPTEESWGAYPVHRNINEWAGYSQVFHADDPVLGPPPWHEIDWKHAGGADSFFQRKWRREDKVRPPWEVLHIGLAGENWFGRVGKRLDGREVPEAHDRAAMVRHMWDERRRTGSFSSEKL